MGFTEEQKAFVREKAMKKMEEFSLEELGKRYFKKIFEKNPSLMNRFPCLRENPPESIEAALNEPEIQHHAVEVFQRVCQSAVKIADNGQLQLEPEVSEFLGQVHNKNGVLPDDYPGYGNPYSDIVEDLFTNDEAEALKEAHCQLMKHMMSAQDNEKLIAEMKTTIAVLEESNA